MPDSTPRTTPLVLVASPNASTADAVAERLRGSGAMAYAAHSWQGALRVATAVGPDVVLVDPAMPSRLTTLLKAHPTSAGATILSLADRSVPLAFRPSGPTRPTPLHAAA